MTTARLPSRQHALREASAPRIARHVTRPGLLLAALLCAGAAAAAAPERGARLYLGLPGGEASCVECHGPDPSLNRNRLLNAAQGPTLLTLAIGRAAAMGYLGGLLDDRDRADVSAWLAQVNAVVEDGSVAIWPWGLEFGRADAAARVAPQAVRLRNPGPTVLALQPEIVATAPAAAGVPGTVPSGWPRLTHDCPSLLPAGAACTAWVDWPAPRQPGRVQAALRWQPGSASSLPAVGIAAETVSDAAIGVARWDDGEGTLSGTAAPGAPVYIDAVLRNAGGTMLTLGTPALTGPERGAFMLSGGTCVPGLNLVPGGACTVRIAAVAPAGGRAEGLLQWRNDGQHPAPRVLRVDAGGAPGGALPPPPPPPPPPAVPPVAPAPPAAPPAVTPAPTPVAPSAGGGGCSVAVGPGRFDPTLPVLVGLAALMIALRSVRRAGSAQALPPPALLRPLPACPPRW